MTAQWLFPTCDVVFKGTLRLFSKFDVQGRENVPRHGPLIIVSNHLSTLDPAIVAAAVGRKPGFLAKTELFKNPVMRFLMIGYGAFPVDRGKADLRALNWSVRRLKKGGAVIMFPEGTRSRGQGLLKAHQGASLLATMTGAPIIPVALTGSEPLQSLLKVLAPVARLDLKIGEPFAVRIQGPRATREELDRITLETMSRIARMLPPQYRGEYAGTVDTAFEATVGVKPAAD